MSNRLLLIFIALVSGCNAQAGGGKVEHEMGSCNEVLKPSALLALSEKCDGRRVTVRGFVREGFENHGIWDSQEDIESANFARACITLANQKIEKYKAPFDSWILLEFSGRSGPKD